MDASVIDRFEVWRKAQEERIAGLEATMRQLCIDARKEECKSYCRNSFATHVLLAAEAALRKSTQS